ncbi:MAG: hypothetical protein A2Y62_11670 [Candidatus Fischerbacteria bacterium RBG_13_37_8]|uniref:Radical SAM protein n=1 Tax=Candidatus Fischerbacteria bacterium RBG_13_37_8 TaxID=1817863 RepID=A0A1F5VH58_9BACT|nr:MAG: hypothetical protein A2Y62_11670 [Candidatus Fischerbacteria bacterium RBG_13_37_8]
MKKIETAIRLARAGLNYIFKREVVAYLPFRLWIEPTSACNLRCVMCPQSMNIPKEHGYMKMDLYKKIIDEAKSFVHDINIHHTGEATLHPRLPEMIAYAESEKIYTKLHTNGTLLNLALSEKIIDSSLSLLSFSFDGFDAETYEGIRIGAQFESTLQNIIDFLKIKKEKHSKKPFVIIEVIDLSNNLSKKTDKYLRFKEKLAGLPLNELRLKQPHNWAGKYTMKFNQEQFAACTFLWYAMVINWSGEVTPCPQDYYCEIFLGDVQEQSLREIWNGLPMRKLRAKMRTGDLKRFKPCETCDMLRRKTVLGIPFTNVKQFLTGIHD